MNRIPNGWKQIMLKEIGAFTKGSGISKSELVETGINAIRYGELYTRHHFKIKKIHSFIPENSTKTSKKIKYGDIIFAGSGETIDEIGKSATYLSNIDCYAGGDTIIMSPKNANSLFLTYTLNVGSARKELRRLGQGQSVVHLYKSDLENLSISLPPLPEQEKIVEVLETWDGYSETLTKVIRAKKKVKKGTIQQLLTGRLRIKGFTNQWKITDMGELFRERKENKCDGLPLLSITSNEGVILQSTSNKKDTSNTDKAKYKRICPDDIGYNTMRMWQGRCALSKIEGIVSPAYTIVTPKKNTNAVYFSYLFKTPRLAYLFFQKSQGLVSDTWNCKFKDFAKVKYQVPGFEEQTAIAQILTTADREIEVLEKKKTLIEAQKKFLLNNLVTGRIRLPELTMQLSH